jgi:hypothetical protein
LILYFMTLLNSLGSNSFSKIVPLRFSVYMVIICE